VLGITVFEIWGRSKGREMARKLHACVRLVCVHQ
jgi:hypothetical protein